MTDFPLFLFALAKALFLTGLGFGVLLAVLAECCGFRVVALGVEKVQSEDRPRALKDRDGQLARKAFSRGFPATSPSRKVRTA